MPPHSTWALCSSPPPLLPSSQPRHYRWHQWCRYQASAGRAVGDGRRSPLCSFTCSFRCFLKLKDFPQAGSGQQKDFWWMCWYFLWCCEKERLCHPPVPALQQASLSQLGTPHPSHLTTECPPRLAWSPLLTTPSRQHPAVSPVECATPGGASGSSTTGSPCWELNWVLHAGN